MATKRPSRVGSIHMEVGDDRLEMSWLRPVLLAIHDGVWVLWPGDYQRHGDYMHLRDDDCLSVARCQADCDNMSVKRLRRKNGSLTCRLLHRWRWWFDATQISRGKMRRVTCCRRCHAWYPRSEAVPVPETVELGSPHSL